MVRVREGQFADNDVGYVGVNGRCSLSMLSSIVCRAAAQAFRSSVLRVRLDGRRGEGSARFALF